LHAAGGGRRGKAAHPTMIRVFVGYDSREAIAFSVLSHSIHARARSR
jgi:hypothetical protein